MKLAVIIITYLNVVRKCCCSCTDQNQQYEVKSDRGADGREKQEQRIFHSLSSPFPPPLPCFFMFFSTSFSYVFFFIPSPSLLLHLFLFLCLLPPPFPVLYTLYFLDVFVNVPLSFQVFLPSQSPSHLCL